MPNVSPRGYPTKLYINTRKVCSKTCQNTFPFINTFDIKGTTFISLPQKMVPFSYTFHRKWHPFQIPTSSRGALRNFERPFQIPKCQVSLPFFTHQLMKSLPSIYLQPEKVPFGQSLPVQSIIGSTPPPPHPLH